MFLLFCNRCIHLFCSHGSYYSGSPQKKLDPKLLEKKNPVNPLGLGLSALSLPLAHDEEKYRSYPQTKALCAPLQGLVLAEAGCTVMRTVEGRMGDQLIPNKDGDLYTKEKK